MPRLLLSQGGRQRPVHVDVGHRRQQIPAPASPQPRPHRVEAFHQLHNIRLGEAPREVSRRRRARDQLRSQGVHIGHVVAKRVDVLQPHAPAQQIVRDIQHMVGLEVGQVPLQQLQTPVDLAGQPQLRHQPPDHADAPEAHRVDPRPDLVADPARTEHRARPAAPPPRLRVPRLHLPLPPGTIPSALLARYCLHRKGLLVDIRRLAPDCANYNQDTPFRYFLVATAYKSRLLGG